MNSTQPQSQSHPQPHVQTRLQSCPQPPAQTHSQTKASKRRQRQLLRAFDKELFSYTGQLAWFLPGLFSFLLLILMLVPVQEIEAGDRSLRLIALLFSIWIAFFVLLPYQTVTDLLTPQKRNRKTYGKLRYLPVSKQQYRLVRLGYLFRFFWKLALIGTILQALGAAVEFHTVSLANFAYAAAILLLAPLTAGAVLIWSER